MTDFKERVTDFLKEIIKNIPPSRPLFESQTAFFRNKVEVRTFFRDDAYPKP